MRSSRHIWYLKASHAPTTMPASAMNEPTASVETPESPCPIVQPSAVTPARAHQHAAHHVVGYVLGIAETFPAEGAGGQRVHRRAGNHADHARRCRWSAPCSLSLNIISQSSV